MMNKANNQLPLGINDLYSMSQDQLISYHSLVTQILNAKIREKQAKAAAQFSVGDTVQFNSKWHGRVTARVMKINQKSIIVDNGAGVRYKCSPSLLTKV